MCEDKQTWGKKREQKVRENGPCLKPTIRLFLLLKSIDDVLELISIELAPTSSMAEEARQLSLLTSRGNAPLAHIYHITLKISIH